MNRLKRIALGIVMSLGLATPALVPAVAHAQTDNTINDGGLQCGAELKFRTEDCENDQNAGEQVDNILETAINIISIIVGIAAVIMIIIGGFRYITSNGDSGSVSGAKNTILYAIIGLVVVALAQIVVRFVVGELTTDSGEGE